MGIDTLKEIWPEWNIDEKPLGKGSYGVVYKGVRTDHNVQSYAAIKIISIPFDFSEVDSLRSEGLDMNATKTYLQGIVEDFVSEIQLMESLKGVQNIVSVEDYKVVERVGEIGWDIYIRMELLTPFNTYIRDKKLTEEQVIKLGCDICTALEICTKRNVIHRDIKPENIFINDFGDFKLGDFGIARKMENMTAGLSQKGTFNYMAPEVVNSNEYDKRVDIYSLGIVLYRLLNNNRLPFLETDQQLMNPNERKNAVERRIRGEQLPPPCNASPAMADLILRACAFQPNDRFASATEMKQALLSVANGNYQISATVKLDRGAMPSKPAEKNGIQSNPQVATFGQPRKKRILPKVAIAALAVVLLVGGGVIGAPMILDTMENNAGSAHSQTSSVKVVDNSLSDKEGIEKIISEAEELASNNDYEQALTKIKIGLATYPTSEELKAKSEEYTVAFHTQTKEEALDSAKTLVENGDYLEAIETIKTAVSTVGQDTELTATAKEYENTYVTNVVTEVDTLMAASDFNGAEKILTSAQNGLPNNQTLKDKKTALENTRPKYLLNVCPPYQTQGYYAEKSYSIAGTAYINGFNLDDNGGGLAYFNLDGKYNTLDFDVGHIDGKQLETGYYYFYADGELIYTLTLDPSMLLEHVEIPLNGAKQLIIQGGDWCHCFALVNVTITGNGEVSSTPTPQSSNGETNPSKYLLNVCPPYQTEGYYAEKSYSIAGASYVNGFNLNDNGGGIAYFNLEGKYNTLTFDVGHIDGKQLETGYYYFYADGELIYTLTLDPSMLLEHVEIPLNGATQMVIEGGNWCHCFALVNVKVAE